MTAASGTPGFAHLRALTDAQGVFEHARYDQPRPEHGYCADDVARALIVTMREPSGGHGLPVETYLRFLERAVTDDGRAHNRMSVAGVFTDRAGAGDWWGRTVWALGATVRHAGQPHVRRRALDAFHRAAQAGTVDLRARAFAALGAADVLAAHPADRAAHGLLHAAVAGIPEPGDPAWWWPEPRLRYANAVLPEALLAAGAHLPDAHVIDRGLRMLGFLVEVETSDGHFSVTGVQGRGRGDRSAQFDQQPIEVAALADACSRAFELTGDSRWRDAVALAWAWFAGENDSATVMYDPDTGAGYDGLTRSGRNENRGAESTLAVLSTYQQARHWGVLHTVAA